MEHTALLLISCGGLTRKERKWRRPTRTRAAAGGDVCWEREERAWHEAGCGASGVVSSQPSPFHTKCENVITNARFLKQDSSQVPTSLSLCSHSLSLTAPQIFALPPNFPADREGGPGSQTGALPKGPEKDPHTPLCPGAQPPLYGQADMTHWVTHMESPKKLPFASGQTPHGEFCAGRTLWGEVTFCACFFGFAIQCTWRQRRRQRTARQKPWTPQGSGPNSHPAKLPRPAHGWFPQPGFPRRPQKALLGPRGWGHGDSAQGQRGGCSRAPTTHLRSRASQARSVRTVQSHETNRFLRVCGVFMEGHLRVIYELGGLSSRCHTQTETWFSHCVVVGWRESAG